MNFPPDSDTLAAAHYRCSLTRLKALRLLSAIVFFSSMDTLLVRPYSPGLSLFFFYQCIFTHILYVVLWWRTHTKYRRPILSDILARTTFPIFGLTSAPIAIFVAAFAMVYLLIFPLSMPFAKGISRFWGRITAILGVLLALYLPGLTTQGDYLDATKEVVNTGKSEAPSLRVRCAISTIDKAFLRTSFLYPYYPWAYETMTKKFPISLEQCRQFAGKEGDKRYYDIWEDDFKDALLRKVIGAKN